jgi:RND superfamily putative drug exporter
MLARWGRFLYLRRTLVLVLSAIGLVASIAAIALAGASLSSAGFIDEEAESARIDALLAEEFGRGGDALVFLFDAGRPVVDPAIRPQVEAALAPLADVPRVARVLTTWNTGNPGFVSLDGDATYAVAQLTPGDELTAAELEGLRARVEEPAAAAGLAVSVGGGAAIGEAIGHEVEEGLLRAETVSVPLTLLIQVLIFGGLVAAGLPLLVGGLAIVGAVAVVFLLSAAGFQSVFAVNIVTMLGLGLGVDYSLFMVARFREEIRTRPVPEALTTTMATVGKAILFSGVTVIFGLAATQFFPLPALRSMGQAGMIVVALALVYGLSFLPALLGVLGRRVDAVPVGRRRVEDGDESRFWGAVARGVMRRPVAILAPVLVLLLVAAVPVLRLDLTPGGPEVLPAESEPRRVGERLDAEFPAGEAEPIPVVATAADGAPLSAGSVAALRAFVADLEAIPGVTRVESLVSPAAASAAFDWNGYAGDPATLPPALAPIVGETVRGDDVLLRVATGAHGAALEDLVREIRALAPAGLAIGVGGFAAAAVDTVDGIRAGVVPAALFVLVGSYLILLLTFGSVFLPLKAIFMTLLSIGAALGAVVLVFQDGYLSGLLGFTASGEIISTTPILMFCILFGLSMDYEVLMLARIQEEHARTGDNTTAVAVGLERTARTITGAAAIMVVVFGGFMLADIVILKSMGFGLALAVLIDATIVRGLLVPATMRLMGRWNWWAPAPIAGLIRRLGLGHAEGPTPAPAPAVGD